MGSMGRIDQNANGIGTKQSVAKGDTIKQVKAFLAANITTEQKKASISAYLLKQKGITFGFDGLNLTIKTSGEYSTTYNYAL